MNEIGIKCMAENGICIPIYDDKKENRMTTIGFLRVGQYFKLNGRKYRVGHLIDGTNGYVACTDVTEEKRKVTRFYIDTSVEELKKGGKNDN